MIPTIGVMVGVYILSRCVTTMCYKDEAILSRTFAGIAFLVTLLCLYDLFTSGTRSVSAP